MITLNFLKAFDNLLRQKLLRKLDNYGIRGKIWRWVSAFLSNRVQQVVLDGEVSSPMPVVIGIPQGSVLVHLLFLSPINLDGCAGEAYEAKICNTQVIKDQTLNQRALLFPSTLFTMISKYQAF